MKKNICIVALALIAGLGCKAQAAEDAKPVVAKMEATKAGRVQALERQIKQEQINIALDALEGPTAARFSQQRLAKALDELREIDPNNVVFCVSDDSPTQPSVAWDGYASRTGGAFHQAAEAKVAMAEVRPAEGDLAVGAAVTAVAMSDKVITDRTVQAISMQQTAVVMTAWTAYHAGVERLAVPDAVAIPATMAARGDGPADVGRAALDVVRVEHQIGRLKAGKPWYSVLLFWR